MKRLIQNLRLGVRRRRSRSVFSFEKVLGNGLGDQLKSQQNCLKFSLSLYIYICPYREEKKREKENTDLIFFFFSSGFVTRLSLSLFLEVFTGSGYSSLHSSAAWGVQKEPGLRY